MDVLTDELRQQLPPIHARDLRLGSETQWIGLSDKSGFGRSLNTWIGLR